MTLELSLPWFLVGALIGPVIPVLIFFLIDRRRERKSL